MTLACLPILILAVGGDAPMDREHAETVFSCEFDSASDANFDMWPDEWVRQRGRGFPRYVRVRLGEWPTDVGSGDYNLQVQMDGGGAAVYSPTDAIEVSPAFSYSAEVSVRTHELVHDEVYLSVTFWDNARERSRTYRSAPLRRAEEWTQLRVGPLAPPFPEVRWAVIGLHVLPTEKADLRGTVAFDDLWVGRVPRMELAASDRNHMYHSPDDVQVTCRVSGLTSNPRVLFELLDIQDQVLASHTARLVIEQGNDETVARRRTNDPLLTRTARWHPPVPGFGFYRVRLSLEGEGSQSLRRTTSLVVMHEWPRQLRGEFGLSLPSGEKNPVPWNQLPSMLAKLGTHWVKVPAWVAPEEIERSEALIRLAERLVLHHITIVGVLDQPPGVTEISPEGELVPSAARMFLKQEQWKDSLEPVMVRLALKVAWWQLGADDDLGFVEYPALNEKLREVQEHLNQYGQQVRLGVSWRWMNAPPLARAEQLAFLSLREDPPFTPEELAAYAARDETESRRWVTIQPLPRSIYPLETRARDLVRRMLAAKVGRADAIFLSNPFDDEYGLMDPAGRPSELLLPWRTTASLLAGADYAGSLQLPHGSPNYVFTRGPDAIIVIWNERPVTEEFYVGPDVVQYDLWGRRKRPSDARVGNNLVQAIEVTTEPTFLVGAHGGIAKWRLGLEMETVQLASVFGREQSVHYRFTNPLSRGVSGTLELIAPPEWQTQHRHIQFKMSAGETQRESFRVFLRPEAGSGNQLLRFDAELHADAVYRFSVYRTLLIGLGDVDMELETRMGEDGVLIVEQHLINNTDEDLNFNCLLFAPQRRRQRQQVLHLPRGRTTVRYFVNNGEDLIGTKLWVRAEEIGGARILNYHVVATE